MWGSRTDVFTEPDDYRAGLGSARIDVFLACPGGFSARLTRVELGHLALLHGQENQARVAHLTLSPKFVFITFPTDRASSMKWAGVDVEPGAIVFHSRGERMYQRTMGACRWGAISLTPHDLVTHGRALVEQDFIPPSPCRVLRPLPSALHRLRSLHKTACRLVETKPAVIAHPEVVRSIEQDLVHALVTCLATADVVGTTAAHRHHVQVMGQFEELLEGKSAAPLPIPELCRTLGVSKRSLQMCCSEFLGMSPNQYLRLRRMHAAHLALRHAGSATLCVADVASRHGFSEPGRFAVAYRALFGERPSDTLRRCTARPS